MDIGKALSDRPALKPDWGKPAVRNFREEDGNGSYRAILLPEERDVYPYALSTRKSAGLMTRKLSLTESQKTAQFFGTSSRRKRRTELQKSL